MSHLPTSAPVVPDRPHRRRRRAALAAGLAVSVAASVAAYGTLPAPASGGAAGDRGDGGRHRARNVIFIQGDGMGISHRELIRLATKGRNGELAMDSMRYSGLVHTDPADPVEPVTDSAAAATAYSTGVKSYNGAIAVDTDGDPVRTLLEDARAQGKATGLVTTSQVTDASPAAFGAHVPDRGDQSGIALQYLTRTRPDVIMGGGEDWWLPSGTEGAWPDRPSKDPTEESHGTEGNLVRKAEALGYDHVSNPAQLRASDSRKLLGLFANEEMFEHRNEGEGAIYRPAVPLRQMAAKALEVLSRDRDGFFLFLEEEGIDEMAHHNNAHLTIKSGAALDRTVQLALRFAAGHPGTLVLVVGDHETGGLAIENVDPDDESGDEESSEDGPFRVAGTDLEFEVDWTTDQHTGAATPLTAQGPGARRLVGVQQNTDVHDAVLRAMRGRG